MQQRRNGCYLYHALLIKCLPINDCVRAASPDFKSLCFSHRTLCISTTTAYISYLFRDDWRPKLSMTSCFAKMPSVQFSWISAWGGADWLQTTGEQFIAISERFALGFAPRVDAFKEPPAVSISNVKIVSAKG